MTLNRSHVQAVAIVSRKRNHYGGPRHSLFLHYYNSVFYELTESCSLYEGVISIFLFRLIRTLMLNIFSLLLISLFLYVSNRVQPITLLGNVVSCFLCLYSLSICFRYCIDHISLSQTKVGTAISHVSLELQFRSYFFCVNFSFF